MKIHPVGVES